jgi:hypothetical protein
VNEEDAAEVCSVIPIARIFLRTALPDLLYPPRQTNGLFSVPAPSLHLGETAGFFIALVIEARRWGGRTARSSRVSDGISWEGARVSPSRLSNDPWFLQGSHAKLACGGLLAEIDVERPTRGLHHLKFGVEKIDGWLMGVNVAADDAASEAPWQPADVYTRGADLVATYREPLGQLFTLQVYWRVLPLKNRQSAALESIVSIQTREWEAHPHVTLTSALSVHSARLENGGVLFRSHHDWTYVEATPPGDFTPSACESKAPNLHAAAWTYGHHFMERGVIRRLRLRGAIVPIADAEDALEQLSADLVVEPPPLTA